MEARNILSQSTVNSKLHDSTHSTIKKCIKLLNDILDSIYDVTVPHKDTSICLKPSQYVSLNNYGYRYVLLLVTSLCSFTLRYPGLGDYKVNAKIGWHEIPMLTGASISVDGNSSISLLQRCTNIRCVSN